MDAAHKLFRELSEDLKEKEIAIYQRGIADSVVDERTKVQLKDLPGNLPQLSQLIGFFQSSTMKIPEVRDLIKGGSREKAQLFYFHALENNWIF